MSPEPSTTVSSAAHSGAEYNEEYLREVIETASGFMLSQHDIVVPGEFKRHNISNQHRVSNDHRIILFWSDEHSEPEPRPLYRVAQTGAKE
jgi:hypothetical protein